MSAPPLRFPSPLPPAPEPDESGVRPVVREEEIDTLPPPADETGDAYTHVTVVRAPSPELLACLRAVDVDRAAEPSVDPSQPHAWNEPPSLESGQEAVDGGEVPRFRDHRAELALAGAALVIGGSAVLMWLAS